ncbi:hypothetical protein [Candidatus Thiosymbion oneisti]|uniref:hypothetical protein n=1 Tax=Candidatus Thiosymbion oneisti TaxID=589554 RepID=UPI0013FD6B13|nr:hypothetical protein [Candidatus Thiosymbion oneisti]
MFTAGVTGAKGRMHDEVTGHGPARIEGGRGTVRAHFERHPTQRTVRTGRSESNRTALV